MQNLQLTAQKQKINRNFFYKTLQNNIGFLNLEQNHPISLIQVTKRTK